MSADQTSKGSIARSCLKETRKGKRGMEGGKEGKKKGKGQASPRLAHIYNKIRNLRPSSATE